MNNLVLVEKKGSSALVTLNRPKKMNALSPSLLKEFVEVFEELENDEKFSAVILTGSGSAFCGGADLEILSKGGPESYPKELMQRMLETIPVFSRPVIGAVNGMAATGGFEVALMCDVLVACENTEFVDTHARVGLLPGWGLSQRLQRIVGINRARDLMFTGKRLSAQEALNWGLVSRLVASENLITTCEQMADDIANSERRTLINYKRLVNKGAEMSLDEALNLEMTASKEHSSKISASEIASHRRMGLSG